jgi:hypothetical protein
MRELTRRRLSEALDWPQDEICRILGDEDDGPGPDAPEIVRENWGDEHVRTMTPDPHCPNCNAARAAHAAPPAPPGLPALAALPAPALAAAVPTLPQVVTPPQRPQVREAAQSYLFMADRYASDRKPQAYRHPNSMVGQNNVYVPFDPHCEYFYAGEFSSKSLKRFNSTTLPAVREMIREDGLPRSDLLERGVATERSLPAFVRETFKKLHEARVVFIVKACDQGLMALNDLDALARAIVPPAKKEVF